MNKNYLLLDIKVKVMMIILRDPTYKLLLNALIYITCNRNFKNKKNKIITQ